MGDTFTENSLCSTDKKATFTPHLTIAKTSKTSARKRVKMIDPKCYERHKQDCFGTRPINTLELLSMTSTVKHPRVLLIKQQDGLWPATQLETQVW